VYFPNQEKQKINQAMWLFSLLFSFAVSSENAGHLVPDLKLGCTNIHTVKEGDICDRIWKEYNLKDLNELLALNSGLDCANLFENQVLLYIPYI
jgi:hypothetical protein